MSQKWRQCCLTQKFQNYLWPWLLGELADSRLEQEIHKMSLKGAIGPETLLKCTLVHCIHIHTLLLLLLSHCSRVRLCATPKTAAHQAPLSLGSFRQEHWSGLPFPSPVHESEKWKWSCSFMSNSWRPHGLQPTRLLRPWDFPGKSTGVGCHCLLCLLMCRRYKLISVQRTEDGKVGEK